MPSKRADVLTRLAQWESRGALPVEEELDIVVREEEELVLEEDDNESDFGGDFNRGFKWARPSSTLLRRTGTNAPDRSSKDR